MDCSLPTAAWRDNSSCVIIIQEDENECILKIKPLNWKILVKSLQTGLVFSQRKWNKTVNRGKLSLYTILSVALFMTFNLQNTILRTVAMHTFGRFWKSLKHFARYASKIIEETFYILPNQIFHKDTVPFCLIEVIIRYQFFPRWKFNIYLQKDGVFSYIYL